MSKFRAWRFEWRRGHDEVAEGPFAAYWQGVVDASEDATVFSEPHMVRIWLETKGVALGVTPHFCVAQEAEGAQAVLPLCIWPAGWRKGWRRRAVPAGEPHFDYQDPVASPRPGGSVAWEDFWRALSVEVRTSVTWFELLAAFRLRAPIAPTNAETDAVQASPYIDVASYHSLDELLAGKAGKHRGDVRRQRRRLAELGELELEVLDSESGRAAVDEFGEWFCTDSMWVGAGGATWDVDYSFSCPL